MDARNPASQILDLTDGSLDVKLDELGFGAGFLLHVGSELLSSRFEDLGRPEKYVPPGVGLRVCPSWESFLGSFNRLVRILDRGTADVPNVRIGCGVHDGMQLASPDFFSVDVEGNILPCLVTSRTWSHAGVEGFEQENKIWFERQIQ